MSAYTLCIVVVAQKLGLPHAAGALSLSLSLPWMKNGSPQLLEKRATGRDYFNGVFLIQKCPNRVDNLFQFWPDPIVREIQFFRKFEHHIIFNLFLGIHIIQIKKFIYLSKNNHGKYG